MASSKQPSNLIFAPGSKPQSSQADQYTKGSLSRSSLSSSPFTQFHEWFKHAQSPSPTVPDEPIVYQPETVCLSTAHLPSGSISSRFVYLKELDSRGFVVYSNWGTSRKARDVESNPQAGLAFWWREVERQIRVEGRCERLSNEESQRYFSLRGRGSRVGAWASRQSEVLPPTEGVDGGEGGEGGEERDDGRRVLERQVNEVEEKFEGQEEIPVPEFWGGLRVVPSMVEFWQGRDSRLHDRFRYTRVRGKGEEREEGEWKIERLSP